MVYEFLISSDLHRDVDTNPENYCFNKVEKDYNDGYNERANGRITNNEDRITKLNKSITERGE